MYGLFGGCIATHRADDPGLFRFLNRISDLYWFDKANVNQLGGESNSTRLQPVDLYRQIEDTMLNILQFRKKRDLDRVYGSEVVEIETRGHSRKRIGVIRDISPTGACIRIHDAASLARTIKLSSPSIGEDVASRIRWRRGTEIGVRFYKPLARPTKVAAE
jgi:hypothetical protein